MFTIDQFIAIYSAFLKLLASLNFAYMLELFIKRKTVNCTTYNCTNLCYTVLEAHRARREYFALREQYKKRISTLGYSAAANFWTYSTC